MKVQYKQSFQQAMLGIILVPLLSTLSVLFCVFNANAANTAPSTMNFQGRLTDTSGNIVANGSYNVKFTIYNAGSSAIWTETRETTNRVVVANGLFSVQLGSVTPITPALFTTTGLTLGVTMANPATATCSTASCQTWEAEMSPRSPIATSAYAFNADTIDGIDGASLAQLGANNTFTGTQSITATSATALTVGSLLTADTSGTIVKVGTSGSATGGASVRLLSTVSEFSTSVRVGNGTDGIDFTTSGVQLKGTARPTRTITLAPEFPGATFTADGTNNNGTLSSDFCSQALTINATACPTSGDVHNYYAWTTTQATAQDYDVYVRYRVPSDFSTSSLSNVYMYGWRTGASDTVEIALFQANMTQCGTTTNVATGTATWTETAMAGTLSSCSIAADDVVTFRIKLTAGAASDITRAGEIRFSYLSKY